MKRDKHLSENKFIDSVASPPPPKKKLLCNFYSTFSKQNVTYPPECPASVINKSILLKSTELFSFELQKPEYWELYHNTRKTAHCRDSRIE